jgi:uncharacterized Rossmann fold enzyme
MLFRNMFRYIDWWKIYREIADMLGIEFKQDYMATTIAYHLISNIDPPLNDLSNLIFNRDVIVFGAGPSLVKHIDIVERYMALNRFVIVAANGATKALLERGFIPHIIVSDLDGDLNAILFSVSKGSYIAVHVHGDNIEVFIDFIQSILRLSRRFVVTTQIEAIYPLFNFGGFTDGDRAVILALSFYPQTVVLAGMDFGDVVGKYSKPWMDRNSIAVPKKRIKLDFGRRIVSEVLCRSNVEIYIFPPTSIDKCVNVLYSVDDMKKRFL